MPYLESHFPLNYSLEWNIASDTILGEVRIRSVRILIGLGFTWFTCYWFSEELISPLAKPFLTLPLDSYFVRTQSTEASPTYVATSSIACSYFVFPLISHQIWCFSIPSCYGEQRTKYNRFLYLSGSRFSLFLFLTPTWVVPNVWHFPYNVGATSTNLLMIKLQPKIYDHIIFNCSYFVHSIGMLPSTCHFHLFAKGSFCRNLNSQSSFFDGFSAYHSSSFHTSGYLVPNRRPFPYFFDNRVGYLCGIDYTSS
ncbi:unnamed protein product [Musa hybrid cultivar]